MEYNTTTELLDFAISEEQGAFEFYMALADRVEQPSMKRVFEEFAREEMSHKAKLERIKAGQMSPTQMPKVMDLKIDDYLVAVEPSPNMDYQDALIVAMKKEKAAFKMYSDMAAAVESDDLKATLLSLAQEEARHKLRFEIEYDDQYLAEN